MSGASTVPTPATPDVCDVTLLVEGNELPGNLHVMSVVVRRELNRVPAATVQIRDGEASKATFQASDGGLFLPGNRIEIRLGYRSENDTVFKGIVVRHGISLRKNGSVLTVECRDEAVKMTGSARSRYWVERKDSDIIEEIVGSYGLDMEVATTIPELQEVTQYDSTDWDFLVCRAEANGMVVIVTDGKVTVATPATGDEPVLSVGFGSTLLELDAEIDARRQSEGALAFSWSPGEQEVLEAEASEPEETTAGNLEAETLAGVLGVTREMRHAGPIGQQELQAWADGRLLKERLAKVRGRARFQGFAGIAPGGLMELTGVGERFQGKVYVSGVRHQVSNGNWETDVQFGVDPERFAETFNLRPLPASGLVPGVSGLQMGVVTVLEQDPLGEDRIKVRLPLISPQEEGIWARLATLDAGKERGTYFRPEIGDEVVVGFLGGDPRHPVLLGSCHSSAKPAPEAASDDNHLKGYVSRGKMRLAFDDEKNVLLLETPAGNRVTMSEENEGIAIEDQNGNKIVMDSTGITVESAKDLTLKAAKDVNIEAAANLTVKAQTAFKAEGAASAEVTGASTTIKGSAQTVIQGGVVQIN